MRELTVSFSAFGEEKNQQLSDQPHTERDTKMKTTDSCVHYQHHI